MGFDENKHIKGDITRVKADAIVNAANSSLMGGGGVDGAIHRAADPRLLEGCKKLRKNLPDGLPAGEAVITKAYSLPAKYVIHTVGPVYNKDDISFLKKCYLNSLELAEKNNCESISFPAISTGIYGVPVGISAGIAKEVIGKFGSLAIKEVTLVLFKQSDYQIYKKAFT
ncbi:O-acetyl-ADP-ribose deacetylase [Candidatus Woesearchaeota archaeon]|nr:O-acetyl-ADP-ribose deacetylase [Candidatus Woesearchaeota archaeon]